MSLAVSEMTGEPAGKHLHLPKATGAGLSRRQKRSMCTVQNEQSELLQAEGAVVSQQKRELNPSVPTNKCPNPPEATFGATDIRLMDGYKPPVPKNKCPNPPKAIFGATDIRLMDGYKPPVPKNQAPPPSAEDFARLINERSRAEVEKWNFCRRVREGEVKCRRLEKGQAFTEKLLLDALQQIKEKDLAFAKMKEELHHQKEAEILNQQNYSDLLEMFKAQSQQLEETQASHNTEIQLLHSNGKMREQEWLTQEIGLKTHIQVLKQRVRSHENDIKLFQIKAKARDEELATQEISLKTRIQDLKQRVWSHENDIKLFQINAKVRDEELATQEIQVQTLIMNKNHLEDVCFSMKKKSRGVFGKKLADQTTEVDKMVQKMKAKDEKKKERTGFFGRLGRKSQGGSEELEEAGPSPPPSLQSSSSSIHPISEC